MNPITPTPFRFPTLVTMLALAAALLTACGSGSEPGDATGGGSGDAQSEQSAAADGSVAVGKDGLRSIDGRAVKASDTELVLRTADGERDFKIMPEDVAGVGPEHVKSHIGIPTLGFRVYFRTEDDVDYAVSAEEIPASGLGFD